MIRVILVFKQLNQKRIEKKRKGNKYKEKGKSFQLIE